MHGPTDDPLIDRVADVLRRPAPLRPDFDARVMASVRRALPPWPVRAWRWIREPRAVAVSPLGGMAMAAALAGVVFVGVLSRGGTDLRPPTSDHRPPGSGGAVATFVLVAPEARSVALVGDFNGWDAARMPLRRDVSGLWTVEVPLAAGRYQYAFVLDGGRFVADPSAPRAVGDDFGTPSSVVTVGGAGRAAGGAL